VRIRFGPFVLDLDTRQLIEDKREIHLTPKAFDLLTMLVMDRPKVLSKAALQNRLWPDTFVAEANLSNLVAEIREALRDDAHAPTFIRTAHGFGYAFSGDAATVSDAAARHDRPSCWLEWDRLRFPLSLGEHVIGRDPDVEVRLDDSTVSRRDGARGLRQQERHVSRRRTCHRPGAARRWRCDSDRIAAGHLPLSLADDVDRHADADRIIRADSRIIGESG
jgi:DNA-binding winged helix-turn-helix (wHTH) protein